MGVPRIEIFALAIELANETQVFPPEVGEPPTAHGVPKLMLEFWRRKSKLVYQHPTERFSRRGS